MKILLLVATSDEIINEYFSKAKVLISGAGMINTTYALTKHLSKNSYDLVVNMGIAGSFNSAIKIGDTIEVVEDTLSEIGYEDENEFNEFTEFKITNTFKVEGITNLQQVKGITVNTVHGNEKSIAKIVERINPDVESMEGAACFMVCKKFNISCIQIRAISNKVEKRNKETWDLPLAIKNLNETVAQIITEL